ncbi:hypothetical protein P152DRAFT_38394 [Eremomyces bilateralis CBS 781.70]|uniref:Uncharacterized protein n=1 Tax=Eremomyces bilateralis CBS 781.70 TaxID=1392243 RepID=A0A6G1G1S9_9PEZI|nr:uncharacterized protein P152DRAFT_38394 [Eremomyces bilateralis CBS 781.70]KAF1811942.1 hypothetical protein P152DRAFT_38394 [Eremomyces bilateralis CBS 781.70]
MYELRVCDSSIVHSSAGSHHLCASLVIAVPLPVESGPGFPIEAAGLSHARVLILPCFELRTRVPVPWAANSSASLLFEAVSTFNVCAVRSASYPNSKCIIIRWKDRPIGSKWVQYRLETPFRYSSCSAEGIPGSDFDLNADQQALLFKQGPGNKATLRDGKNKKCSILSTN